MIRANTEMPMAVTSGDDQGIVAGVEWSGGHMRSGDVLTVWTPLARDLAACASLDQLVRGHRDVTHAVGRGSRPIVGSGPVVALWPDMDHIGELMRSSQRFRALSVITSDADQIRPWVTFAEAEVLGDASLWEALTPALDPVVVLALEHITRRVNLANPIAASGWDKDDAVEPLLALHRAGYELRPEAVQGWALANGWYGDNPATLAKYARDIAAGKRIRIGRSAIGSDYVDTLRKRVVRRDDLG